MKIEINPSVSYTELHGEVTPSNIEAGLYYCIGGAGKQIRESLLQGQEAANVTESLVATYPTVDKQKLKTDVRGISNVLTDCNIIRLEKI